MLQQPDDTSPAARGADACTVVELRQYTLHPGQRDVLIELFDREFIETQEAVGLRVMGQFRDRDRPDRFVWLRGFADMAARRRGLQAFYGGPVGAAHRQAANRTMIDSADVLLLRPAWPGAAGALVSDRQAMPPGGALPRGAVDVTVFPLREPAGPDLLRICRERWVPMLAESGVLRQAWYVTEDSANDFPALPIRKGEPVLVGVAVFASAGDPDRLHDAAPWAGAGAAGLSASLAGPPQRLRLSPTARSAIHA